MWVFFTSLSASFIMLLYYQQLIPISVLYLGIVFDGVATGLIGASLVYLVLNYKLKRNPLDSLFSKV